MRLKSSLATLLLMTTTLAACGVIDRLQGDDDPDTSNNSMTLQDMGSMGMEDMASGAEDMGSSTQGDMAQTTPDMMDPPEEDMSGPTLDEDLLEDCQADPREDRCEADPSTYLEWGEFFAPAAIDLLAPDCCFDINDDGLEDNYYAELIEALGGVGGPDRDGYNGIIAEDLSDLDARLLYEIRPNSAQSNKDLFITSHVGTKSGSLKADEFVVGAYRPTSTASFAIDESGQVSFAGGALDVRMRMLGVPFIAPLQLEEFEGTIARGMAQPSTMTVRVSGYVKLEDIFDGINRALPEYCGCVDGITDRSISWPGNNLAEAMCSIEDEDLGACESGDEQERYCAQRLTFCSTFASLATAGADIASRRPAEECGDGGEVCDAVSMSFDIDATAISFQGVE